MSRQDIDEQSQTGNFVEFKGRMKVNLFPAAI